jgi:GGDEF domain-containing protein
VLRTTDLLCRYGGEEFSVLLPNATTDQAAEVLERLRQVTPQGQTFSAGFAGWDGREVSNELSPGPTATCTPPRRPDATGVIVDQ